MFLKCTFAGVALSVVFVCGAQAQAQDSQPLRTFYGTPQQPQYLNPEHTKMAPVPPSTGTPGNYQTVPVQVPPLPYNGSAGAPNNYGYHPTNNMPPVSTGHAPGTMPNPAYMPTVDNSDGHLQKEEHQRRIDNMRRMGYSEDRIRSYDQQFNPSPALPPGARLRKIGPITVIDDGSTPQQRLNNITHSGLLDTPISTDPHHYSSGTYGYYKTHGGTKGYGQWLDDGMK
jgi:hypothetical protein